jgi:hypothetical protein
VLLWFQILQNSSIIQSSQQQQASTNQPYATASMDEWAHFDEGALPITKTSSFFKPYASQRLEWQAFSSFQALNNNSTSNTGSTQQQQQQQQQQHADLSPPIRIAQEQLASAVHEKQWLLQQDQHISLPQTHLQDQAGAGTTTRVFSIGDFVVLADEARARDVQACAAGLDNKKTGNDDHRIQLSPEQVNHLQQTGELKVNSVLFENQHHIWKLAPGFYSGNHTRVDDFGQGIGRMLEHAVLFPMDSIVGAPSPTAGDSIKTTSTSASSRRILLPGISLRGAVTDGLGGAIQLLRSAAYQLGVLGGGINYQAYSQDFIEELLDLAERVHVQDHLQRRKEGDAPDTRRLYRDFGCITVSEKNRREQLWNILLEQTPEWAKECTSISMNDNASFLSSMDDARKAMDSTRRDYDQVMRGSNSVLLQMDQAKTKLSPKAAIQERNRAREEWNQRQVQAWKDHLQDLVKTSSNSNKDMQSLALLELDRLRAEEIEKKLVQEDKLEIEQKLVAFEERLGNRHFVFSLSKIWTGRKRNAERVKITRLLEKSRKKRVAARLDTQGLMVQGEASKLADQFQKDLRKDLAIKLGRVKATFPPAKFEILQLNPKNWRGHNETGQRKYKAFEVDIGKPFWRLRYSWLTLVSLFKSSVGGSYHFLLNGPLSVRALLSPSAYYAIRYPNPDQGSFTPTLTSRLGSFFNSLGEARQNFEATPDRGLIGKSVQRFFLVIYLTMKAVVGSAAIVSFMTIGTVVVSAFNALVLVASPALALGTTLLIWLFNLVIYDTALGAAHGRLHKSADNFSESCGRKPAISSVSPVLKIAVGVPYCLVIPGALQVVLASLKVVGHPIIAVMQLAWSSLRYSARTTRDTITWFFVRNYSRIPAEDTFLAWRIHGPGLAAKEYYRLPLEAVKASIWLFLDRYRLQAHAAVRKAELVAPYEAYKDLFKSAIQPFGLGITMNVPSPSTLGLCIASQCARDLHTYGQHRGDIGQSGPSNMNDFTASDDIWDTLAKGIRSAHPDYRALQGRGTASSWSRPGVTTRNILDEEIQESVDRVYQNCKSTGTSELDEMVNRAAKIWAEVNLKMNRLDQRLGTAIAIPPHAADRFFWTQSERDDLWEFTLKVVESFAMMLKEELRGIQAMSEFGPQLEPSIQQVTDAFNTKSGARPGQDFPTVAAFLLAELLGGEHMLDTLEEIDENLILCPKMSAEDEHLVFWKKSYVGGI